MRRKGVLLMAGLFCALLLRAQTPGRLSAEVSGQASFVTDGHGLYNLLQDRYGYGVFGAAVGYSTRPGDGWFEKAFNYPTFGLGFSYANMGSLPVKGTSRLGDIYNLYGWAQFDFLRSRRFRLGPVLELGLSYSPVAFDARTNPDNKYFGSHLFALIGAGVRGEWRFAGQWSAFLDIHLVHHSNGMTKAPNWGVNEVAAGGGVRRYFGADSFAHGGPQMEPEYRKGMHWSFFAAGGVHSCPVELDGMLATGTGGSAPARLRGLVGVEWTWRYSPVFASGLAVDGGYNANRYRETDLALQGREDQKGYSPFYVCAGLLQEFWFRQVSVRLEYGWYLFKRTGLTEDIGTSFQKLGIRYHFSRNRGFFVGLDMRAHYLDRSYALEWTAGYRL